MPVRGERKAGAPPPGFSLVELLIVVLVISSLAAIAVPGYQHLTHRARAAALIQDLRVIGTAAYEFELENNRWPEDVYPEIVPPELEGRISGIRFSGPGYRLDWENWLTTTDPIDGLIGVSVLADNVALQAAFVEAMEESRLLRLDNRYIYVIAQY